RELFDSYREQRRCRCRILSAGWHEPAGAGVSVVRFSHEQFRPERRFHFDQPNGPRRVAVLLPVTTEMTSRIKLAGMCSSLTLALFVFSSEALFAGQGAQRMLYTSPNMGFIEQPSGEVLVTVNDTSGLISTLQTEINNARAANPTNVIVIRLTNATYTVSSAGIVLGSHECLVASGATIQAANSSVTTPLITITSGSTNVSVSAGIPPDTGQTSRGSSPPAAARVNIDNVTVRNCGQDCILLKGNGNSTYDNEMTVTRCTAFGSPAHAGISIQNS